MICFAWASWKMEDRLYRAFVIAAVLVSVIGLAAFVFFPTYVQRPFLGNQDDWSLELLHVVYANDRVYNAFPSGHVYITTLIGLFWAQWFPHQRWWWLAIIVVIAFSTLFTHQHYLPDPIGGMLLAWAGYRFSLWWVNYPGPGERTPYQPKQESIVHTG